MTSSPSVKASKWHVTPSPHRVCPPSRHSATSKGRRRHRTCQHPRPQSALNKHHAQTVKSPTTSLQRAQKDGTSVCIDCYRAKRRRGRRQGNPPPAPPAPPATVTGHEVRTQIAASHSNVGNQHSRCRKRQQVSVANKDNGKSRHGDLDHHIFTKGAWQRAHLRDHPKVAITISNDTSSPRNISKSNSSVTADVSAVADSDLEHNQTSGH